MRRPLFIICLCLVAVATLWLWLENSSHERGGKELAFPGEELTVTGRVYSKDTQSFTITSIHVQISDVASSRRIIPSKTKIICENKKGLPNVRIGSTVMVKGNFAPFSQATNDGEFDGKKYYECQNIQGKFTDVVLYGESRKYSVMKETLYHLREYFKQRIYRVFPEKEASLLVAMLLGDKEELDGDIKELYRRNGIIHILSISELHITLIGMGIYKLLRRLGMRIWGAAVWGGVLLCIYGVMTGMSLSACRAIGMYLIRMLAEIVGRSYDMLIALGVMAVFLVYTNPGNLGNAGFLLSFGSILGIGILYPALIHEEEKGMERYEPRPWKRVLKGIGDCVGKGLIQAVLSGTSITLFTLPIQLWFYYEVPAYSILLNVLVLPFVSFIVVSGMIAMLVPGTGVVGTLAYAILKVYELVCNCFEQLPFRTWNPGKPEVWQVVVYYVLLLLFVLWRSGNWRDSIRRGSCCIVARVYPKREAHNWVRGEQRNCGGKFGGYIILVLAVGMFFFRPPAKDRVTFLDVGQGDCILLETAEGEVYIFDCGSSSRKQVGEYVLLPFLKYRGIRKIDAVFVSHFDEDHCNGIRELLAWGKTEGITIGELVVPELDEQAMEKSPVTLLSEQVVTEGDTVPTFYMSVGETYPSKGANILCLHPPPNYKEDGNMSSMCSYVEFLNAGFSMLLTGDVEGAGEELLLQQLIRYNIKSVDVLKVAHHGSRNATGEELLGQLTPKVAMISCGRNNRYGHPHEEVVKRLEDAGTEVFYTMKSGQITVELDGKESDETLRIHEDCSRRYFGVIKLLNMSKAL